MGLNMTGTAQPNQIADIGEMIDRKSRLGQIVHWLKGGRGSPLIIFDECHKVAPLLLLLLMLMEVQRLSAAAEGLDMHACLHPASPGICAHRDGESAKDCTTCCRGLEVHCPRQPTCSVCCMMHHGQHGNPT